MPSSGAWGQERKQRDGFKALTSDLLVKPFEASPRQPFVGRPVGEGVGHLDILEKLEDGALHRQLVQVGVEEGDDALREGRRAVEVHCGGSAMRIRGNSWQSSAAVR